MEFQPWGSVHTVTNMFQMLTVPSEVRFEGDGSILALTKLTQGQSHALIPALTKLTQGQSHSLHAGKWSQGASPITDVRT